MSAGRGNPNTHGNRPLFLSASVPNSGCHNLAAPAAAGNTGSINSQVLFSPCSTSIPNTIQEVSARQSAQLSLTSHATEQEDVPYIRPSWNVPRGCTQKPINIIVSRRQINGRGSRAQLPLSATTALPDVSEGASTRLAGSNFLSLGITSSIVSGDMTMNSSQLATPDNLYDEASKTENRIETSQHEFNILKNQPPSWNVPGGCTQVPINIIVFHTQPNGRGSRAQLPLSATTALLDVSEGTSTRLAGSNFNQSEHTQLSTPTVPKEKTLTQIEMQIASAEKTEMFRNEETLPLKMKPREKKYRPKVIRENKLANVRKPDSTPDGKSPNQKIKRSYVWKKRNLSSLENCSGPVSDQSISRATGVAARSRKSVRRSLRFESKEQGLQGDHSSMTSSHHRNYERPGHAQSYSYSESEVHLYYLGGLGGGRGAVQDHGREAMALLQHQQLQQRRRQELEEEEEVARRQLFGGVSAFPAALGHGQQVDYGEDAGGLGDSDAGGSEPEPPPERTHGGSGSGSKRSRAAEVPNLSEKRRRSKINEKMKALQSLIPNSNKNDKASMLDEAIEYLKRLQLQVQMLSMRNGVYLNPPYLSGAIEPAQASQMFTAFGGGNITASSSGAVMPPVNQTSGVHQAFDPSNPPQNQPLSFVLPSVDKTIQEGPFQMESSQSHLRTFRMPESSEMMLPGEVVAKHQITSTQERVTLAGIDMYPVRQESSIVNADHFDVCSRSKE